MKYIFILITLFHLSFQKNNKFNIFPFGFRNNGNLNVRNTPFGQGIIPTFVIQNAPENTKSFAFTIEEHDAIGRIWYHLILTNIDKKEIQISQNLLKENSIQNSWGNKKYRQNSKHSGSHYLHFILYALDTDFIIAKNKEEFEKSIKFHIIDKDEIIGVLKIKD